MNRNAIVLTVVALAVGLMLYTGSRMQSSGAGPAAPARLSGKEVRGLDAPDFELQRLDGTRLKLSSLRGKSVVVNFWATWCGPCKIEMPWLTEFHKQYGPQGVEVIGIAMDEDTAKVADFVKEIGATYTILLGTEAVGDAYGGVQFLPATFYIDRQGKVVDRVFGLVSRSEIEDNIKLSLGPGAAGAPAPAMESHQHHES
ncbi:MAG: TlpA family protein disulfide reductase, partial [Acidobacteria bacterium]|nr:TlpA family protein disulfide reductase [Acidobacteriota bacterium]